MKHRPVLLNEVLNQFQKIREGTIFDATLGKGGHSIKLLGI